MHDVKIYTPICYSVVTAQGKQGIWMFIFTDGKTQNLPKNIKNVFLHREFTFNTGRILKFRKLKDLLELRWDVSRIFCSKV